MNANPPSAQTSRETPRPGAAASARETAGASKVVGIRDHLAEIDADLRLAFASDTMCAILGLREDELLGREVLEAFPALRGTEWERVVRRVMATRRGEWLEHHYTPLDLWWNMWIQPAPGGGVWQLALDSTHRRRSGATIGAADLRAGSVVGSPPGLAVFVLDPRGRYVIAEGESLRHAGMAPADFVGKQIDDVVSPARAAEIRSMLGKALGGNDFVDEHAVGDRLYISRGTPLRSGSGAVWGVLVVSHDISGVRRAAQDVADLSVQRQLALNAARLGWWHYDPVNQRSWWDPRCREIFGLPGAGGDNRQTVDLIHPDDLPGVWTAVGRALEPASGVPYEATYRIRRADGKTLWIQAHGVATFEGDGAERRATGLVGTVEDVTDRMAAEAALKESEERFRLASQAVVGIVFDWDVQKGTVWRSEGLRRVVGYGPEECPETPEWWMQRIHPEDLPRGLAHWERIAVPDGARHYEIEYRVRHKDGRWVSVWERAAVRRDASGRIVRILGTTTDMSERKAAEDARLRGEERLRLATQGAGVGIWEVDLSTGAGEWTPEAAAILGMSRTTFTGPDWLEAAHPGDRAALAEAWRRAVEEGETYSIEFRTARRGPDGGEVWAHSRGTVERDASGRPVRGIGVISDVTAQRRARDAIREQEGLLRGVIESTPDLVWAKDLRGRITMINQAGLEFIGRGGPERVIGRTTEELIGHRPQIAEWGANDERVMRSGAAELVEEESGAGESRRVYETVKAPLRDGAGNVAGIVGVARDVTRSRRQAEGLRHLAGVSARLLKGGTPSELARAVFDELGVHLGMDVFLCYRCADGCSSLELLTSEGLSDETRERVARMELGQQVCGMTAQTRRVRYLERVAALEAPGAAECREIGLRCYLSTPLFSESRLLGVMSFGSRSRDALDENERELVRSATLQFATALERSLAEEALRQRDELLRGVMEGTTDLVWAKDERGRLTLANEAVARLVGAGSASEVIGMDSLQLVRDQGHAERIWANDRAVMQAGAARVVEEDVGHGRGRRTFQSVKAPLRDAAGRVVGLVGVSRDVTAERRRAGALSCLADISATLLAGGPPLDLARAVFSRLGERLGATRFFTFRYVEGADPHLRLIDCEGVDAGVRARYHRLEMGAEVCGLSARERKQMYLPGLQERTDATTQALRSIGLRCYVCTPLVSGDRLLGTISMGWTDRDALEPEELSLATSASLQFGAALERSLGEEALRESETRFRTMADGMPLIVWVHDADGSLKVINRTYCEFYGIDEETVLGGGWRTLLHPEDEAAYTAEWDRCVRERAPFHARARARDASGRWRWLESWGRPRFGSAGTFAGFVGASADITDAFAAQTELLQHRQHLEKLVEERTAELRESHERLRVGERMAAMGTLSAGLGHDMGNLLMPIRVRLETLAAAKLPDDLQKDVEAIRTSAEYLQRLSSGLRLLAIDPSRARRDEVTELGAWWAEAAGVLRSVLPRSVTLVDRLGGGDAPLRVRMPRAALTQAVFNLVQNAGDALRERGRGTIEVSATRGGDRVRLTVADDGPGMTDEVKRRCMEPFFTTKARGISTGLGLALVYGLVNDAGGSVELETRPGAGASFTLVLPAHEVSAASDRPTRTALVEVRDPRFRSFVAGELRALAYHVAEGGESSGPIDLAVVDDPARVETLKGWARAVLLADLPHPRANIRALGPSPTIARIREVIREAASEVSR